MAEQTLLGAFMGYFDDRYNKQQEYNLGGTPDLQSEVGTPEASMASAGGGEAASGMAAAGAMKTNPYLLGGSFLLSYMAAKQKAFEDKKKMDIANQQQYAGNQSQAMDSLNQSWKSALLK
jgi:hypothetical protein